MSFSPEQGKTPAGGIGIPKDMQQGTIYWYSNYDK